MRIPDAPLDARAQVGRCPIRCPDVQLLGEMRDVAFTERQWLVSRAGRFVQLSEALYRVTECADGASTVEELAERVTDSTEWSADAEAIRALIDTTLVPLRLVTWDPSQTVPEGNAAISSPLAMTMRSSTLPREW